MNEKEEKNDRLNNVSPAKAQRKPEAIPEEAAAMTQEQAAAATTQEQAAAQAAPLPQECPEHPNGLSAPAAREKSSFFLECEKHWVYWLLIIVGGYYGAYTYCVRGGVFCNAQTANVVLFAMAIGQGQWSRALYLLIPISAYFLGAFISEIIPKEIVKLHFLRWDTILIGIEILAVIFLGALPAPAPDQICQVVLNFICSMRFNTFRQSEGVPMATTFVTNHIRQFGSNLSLAIFDKNKKAAVKWKLHGIMILMFIAGGIVSALLCTYLQVRTIWLCLPVLVFVFIKLAIADRTYERDLLSVKPHGH